MNGNNAKVLKDSSGKNGEVAGENNHLSPTGPWTVVQKVRRQRKLKEKDFPVAGTGQKSVLETHQGGA